jgi:hypothetical protein
MDNLIDKKKIFQSKRVITKGQSVKVSTLDLSTDGSKKEFLSSLGDTQGISGKYVISCNHFTVMPKGQLRISIEGITKMN